MKLDQIVSLEALESEISVGYINRRFHPEFPTLATVGYSDKCQFDNRWNATTMACRGIIYDTETLEVLARPLHKLFNYGQGDTQYDLDAPILGAFNKFDGSLGIGYTRPDGVIAIATRGSFESEQAKHANVHPDLLGMAFTDGLTPLFEIVYPENRIVLDYGERDELVYLGSIVIETGEYIQPAEWESAGSTLREVLAQPPRKNAEGFVIWLDTQTGIKVKQDDYVALHRIISSLSRKEVWRQLRAGTFIEFATGLPDEFHGWAKATAATLTVQSDALHFKASAALVAVRKSAADDRKSQALWIKDNVPNDVRGLVFSLLDKRDISDSVWRAVEPHGVAEIPTSELLTLGAIA